MARPQKQTVDYFPHFADASAGDTLTVLEGQFGNDGYVFWFKLLEKLASSEGHYLDCFNSRKWQVLLGRAKVDEDTGRKIMVLLVEMQAIDKELWENHSIIWCQNLVDNVAEAYQNRKRELPQKPNPLQPQLNLASSAEITTGKNCIVCGKTLEGMRADAKYCSNKCRLQGFRETDSHYTKSPQNGISTEDNPISMGKNPITTAENPHTILNYTKLYNKDNKKDNKGEKKQHGEFQNVLLTDEEHHELEERFEGRVPALIEKLSAYIASKGAKYKSHYATILNWERRNTDGKAQGSRALPKSYTPTADYPDD